MRSTWKIFIDWPVLVMAMLVIGFVLPAQVFADEVRVTNEQWARSRTIEDFVAIPGLKQLVMQMNENKNSVLDIHFPGGEDGQLWARQFQNRLVALGLGSNRIHLVQGVTNQNQLQIKIGNSK